MRIAVLGTGIVGRTLSERLVQLGHDVMIVLDIANPLTFSRGMPPTLWVSNTNSLGEQIQRAFPRAKVVKSLNTMNARIMVNPGAVQSPMFNVKVVR